jgi:hypothetical protein
VTADPSVFYDVAVCGGGPAGVAAAVAAARSGARTLLIERYGFLGGNSTAAGVNPWMTFHDYHGDQVIRGIGEEIVQRIHGLGGTPGHVLDTVGFVSRFVPLDHEITKFVFDDILAEAGVDVLLHSFIMEVHRSGPALESVRLATKAGLITFRARVFVDTTGDADVAHLAGNATWQGREADGLTQPMTMNFRVGGVEPEPIVRYMRAHPEEFFHQTTWDNLEPLTGVFGFGSIWREAALPIPRESLLFFFTPRPNEVSVNTSRVIQVDATSPFDLTRAEQEGRRQVAMLMPFFRSKIPASATVTWSRRRRRLASARAAASLATTRFPTRMCSPGAPSSMQLGSAATPWTSTALPGGARATARPSSPCTTSLTAR